MAANPPEFTLLTNLRSIAEWINTHAELPLLETNGAFVGFSVEIMNRTLYLLRTGVVLTQEHAVDRGVTRNRAIALGHMVRIMKLYECFWLHARDNRLEICMIFFRLLLETVIRLEYLLTARPSTFRNFVLTSYRPEKEHIADLRQKVKQRPLIPIEKRILGSVAGYLRRDGITQKALLQNRSWDLDGKNFRTLLKDTGSQEWGYSYGFGNGSHFVHGDWRDLTMHHLKRRGGRYLPNPEYKTTDPRPTCAVTTICLRILTRFLRWNRSDRDNFVRPIAEQLDLLNRRLDEAHETYIQQRTV